MPHIMVANDSPEFLGLMQDLLTDEGYRVSPVASGAGTRDAVKRLLPDLIILDLRMPDLNGLDVLSVLQLDPKTASIPVLVCTAAVQDVEVQKTAFEARGIPVLLKPFDLQELLQMVRGMLGNERRGRKADS
jgi:CheY-like chemotaxis protein